MTMPIILVVDDEPRNFDVVEALLGYQTYELQYASSGKEALENLAMFPIALILLDVMMPTMDGIEVCTQIKANKDWAMIPIIMVTALTSKYDLARCLEAGADDFISKPVSALELKARVHSLLRIKTQYDQISELAQLQRNTIDLLRQNLEALQGNLAASFPHELNTPLNGIIGGLSLLLEEHTTMDAEERQVFLQMTYESALRLHKTTQKFLTYTKLELYLQNPERVPLHGLDGPKPSAMASIMKDIADSEKRAKDLQLVLGEAQGVISYADFTTLITELLENAFKFSSAGSPIQVVSQAIADQFVMTVTNQGRSITPEEVQKVGAFQQFNRQLYERQGLGLGLKIVMSIITKYDGALNISTPPEGGTCIEFRLPLLQEASESHP
ncbi:two-component hybrid sensor and regulator [[Synechococcus] sp. NIES-970]|nr:two-component hybrid sensor and regulator [[Synechococcus] sp. NIES-970]